MKNPDEKSFGLRFEVRVKIDQRGDESLPDAAVYVFNEAGRLRASEPQSFTQHRSRSGSVRPRDSQHGHVAPPGVVLDFKHDRFPDLLLVWVQVGARTTTVKLRRIRKTQWKRPHQPHLSLSEARY